MPNEFVTPNPETERWLDNYQLKDCLTELGWTKLELSKRLGLHRNTISRWKEPPAAVMDYLKLRVGIKRLLDD